MMRKPKIRFKGYNEDWEQRKLGELVIIERGGSPRPIDKFITKDENGLNWIKIGDAPEQGNYITQTAEKIKPEGLSKTREVHPGDLILSNSMSFGKPYIMAIDGCIHDGWLVIRDTKKRFDLTFLCTLLGTDSMLNQYKAMAAGSAVNNLNKELVGGTTVLYPDIKEQELIGEYFSHLDHLITLHHRKCVVLRKKKVNDWEQRKLGKVLKERTERAEGNEELLSVTISNGVIRQVDSDKRNIASEDKSNYKIVCKGDIAYNSMRMWQGAVGNSEYDGIVSPAYTVLVPTEEANSKFFMELFKKESSLQIFQRWSQGLTSDTWNLKYPVLSSIQFCMPSVEEQVKIGEYFSNLDHLITLHHRECVILQKTKVNDWEQRKLGEVLIERNVQHPQNAEFPLVSFTVENGVTPKTDRYEREQLIRGDKKGKKYKETRRDDIVYNPANLKFGAIARNKYGNAVFSPIYVTYEVDKSTIFPSFVEMFVTRDSFIQNALQYQQGTVYERMSVNTSDFEKLDIAIPSLAEQKEIGEYFSTLDHLITLHHHEEFCTENVLIYIEINITIQIKEDIMAELESVIEQKLIDQLVYGDSQWTYRADLKTEEDLWNNFRYILEQNNKDRLNGEPLSDTEFEQVKNQLQFSSFYKAGEWLVGENGKVMVHVQRDTERLHLVVMNHEHIAGGSSVYEVINQYRALADEESQTKAQDRRFDVTLMINGLPMIHIELKNKQHSYMDGFWQIKKYIGEGKFTGIFSAVQMFVISNGVDTKYFSAASDTELNPKFISGWLDNENNPVSDYLDFAKSVLRIPEAHEMIARYTVLDEEAKRLILLRPYQIHAIEAIREASKTGKSGFVWHTTGSGKTLTSYKATRNLLMDIPSIDKAIFLIDRKDLDTQTSMAFQAYANNDLVDVDETDNVFDLKKKLKSDDRQMIVTTIQKLQRLITKKLAEGTPEYNKIKSLKIAFVVDECHRAVTPGTKRELERFFANSLWYGFTGTPRFAENPYPQLGDLPRTTEELYGERLHRYTIQNAIHDNAVLGFQVEHNGPKNMDDETDSSMYENETHMLRVLDVILNKSYHKLGFQNGKGKTYEGLLTTSSIQLAQKYYELLKRVKNGETELQIDEKMKQILPDFPKFAITYSMTENEEGSHLNQEKMKESINDYNEMFGTKLDISQIQSYNANLNKRLARKEPKFQSRSEQLDLVIVVDRLLTGFDAPCMSTLFVDRQPMGPHDLIQAFSRTNRIFDKNKTYGQIVTFQAPKLFKECVDNAVKLYSAGSTEIALLAEWEEIEPAFRKALKALRVSAETPAEIPAMSEKRESFVC
ncbi:MAG: HsdR family type I site-specific deoxyribonuclease [Eubacterium sp.]